jgi:hypothetical protein
MGMKGMRGIENRPLFNPLFNLIPARDHCIPRAQTVQGITGMPFLSRFTWPLSSEKVREGNEAGGKRLIGTMEERGG